MNLPRFWSRRPNIYGLLLFALFIASIPLWVRSPYLLSTGIFIGIATIVTMGLCLLMGLVKAAGADAPAGPYILGISCYYHDSTAALLEDGLLIAAA